MHKEPDTSALGSEGASAPVQKRVKIEGATYRHGVSSKYPWRSFFS